MSPPRLTPRSVCVFCGARNGNREIFAQAAQATGRMIAENGWRLVYGAGDVGLMGEVARAAQGAGGEALGIIPQHLMKRERGRQELTTMIITQDMHERKKVMFMNSDVVVVLPGGAGSLDELFEVLTWRQIGLHEKPIYLVNTEGYWDPLLTLMDHIISQGFAEPFVRDFLTVVPDAEALEAALRTALA
ncbi:TIGR00730 family Rossman fold protein [Falsigemmobacter intermedius]|uniref:LOG family protein n=1 Tax=Falsigemmobacter intermedius TaxID=1553448 RepID=UPI003EFCBDE2